MQTRTSDSHVIAALVKYAQVRDTRSFDTAIDVYIAWGKTVDSQERLLLCQATNDAIRSPQMTIEAWKREEVPPVENDGILTAEDVSTLDLQGTWLVTLSACDTGSGEARAGEGVMGLRRGFIQAGAQNLLMTLWPISDEVTVQIMSDFYDAVHHTGNAPEALAEVQRKAVRE
jgi:CHAT domain-containing protein